MAVLITGYKGFIGQNMMSALPNSAGYEWGDGAVSLEGITRVIHLGAISSTACADWGMLYEQNIRFSIDLISACADWRIPVQFASSASVYGADATTFCETDTPNPQSLYAKSKRAVEDFVLGKSWRVPVQMFRYFNVYGQHEDHKDQPSPHARFRRQALETACIEVFEGSEDIRRDFVPVERVINVHKCFFDLNETGVYNLGTGEAVSFMDVAQSVALETNARVVTVPMPDISGYQQYTQADMTKTHRALKGV
jgi:ADP-L-glycero-D-manno-heptose 6-epimerase